MHPLFLEYWIDTVHINWIPVETAHTDAHAHFSESLCPVSDSPEHLSHKDFSRALCWLFMVISLHWIPTFMWSRLSRLHTDYSSAGV